jgi:hypothetical protein
MGKIERFRDQLRTQSTVVTTSPGSKMPSISAITVLLIKDY